MNEVTNINTEMNNAKLENSIWMAPTHTWIMMDSDGEKNSRINMKLHRGVIDWTYYWLNIVD